MLSSALFSHLQAAQAWSLGELSCTCTGLAERHPSLPKHEGHLLLFSDSDSHELFDPDTVSMLSGSMRNSFFPPRGILMNRLIQAFHHWARTNNLPLLDPSALSTIVDFHFDLHFPQATLGMQIFSAFRQTRGPMGSPASPALCLMVIAVIKQIWANTHPTSGPRSFEDNRLVVATCKWFSTPAAHIVCDEHFYGGDILLETETALDFLGFSTGL